jgi:hypothetical protein
MTVETYVREVKSIDGHTIRFERDEPLFMEAEPHTLEQIETRIYVDDEQIDATGAYLYELVTGNWVVNTSVGEFEIDHHDERRRTRRDT